MTGEPRSRPAWRRRRIADGGPSAAQDRAFGLLAETANRRAMAWRALALAYRPPTAGWVAGLAAGALWQDLAAVADWLPSGVDQMASPGALVQQASAELTAAGGGGFDAALAEYARLYDPDHGLVPLVESEYLGNGGRAEVERLYAASGLRLAASRTMPADHVAIELEFVYVLCRQEESAWDRADLDKAKRLRRTEREFLRRHLASWAYSVGDGTRVHALLQVYPALAVCLERILAIETRLPRPES